MTELPEKVQAKLLLQMVVTLVQFHYPRVRDLHDSLQDREAEFTALVAQREQLGVVRKRVEAELVETAPLNTVSPRAAEVRQAVRMFLVATQEMLDFEREASAPVVRVFMESV